VHHINGDRLNNNINNLRLATQQEHQRGRKLSSNNTSTIKGVSYHKRLKKWTACIYINGIRQYLGNYEHIEDAALARKIKANEVYGEFVNECERIK